MTPPAAKKTAPPHPGFQTLVTPTALLEEPAGKVSEGWKTEPLAEVVDILDSRRIPVNSTERAKRTGNVPYYGATGQVGFIDKHIFDEELVLLGEDGAPFLDSGKPKAYLINGKSWVNNHAHVLRGKPGLLNGFLLYQLNNLDYRPYVSGTTRLKLPQGPMKQIPLLVPPLDEQRRIVAEIEKQFTRLDAGVSALKRVQANLKRYRAAVLKAACEGTLVETKAKWPQKQIVTAIQTMDQGWSPRCEREPSDNDATWAVIKTTAIQNLRFVEIENKKLPEALKPRPHLELQAGDLLVTRAGPRNRVGVACLVKSTRPRLMLCDKAYRLRCKPNVAHPAFLELVLNTPHIVDEVNKLKTGISDSGVNLTQKRFGELLIPLPPLAEQKRIVEEVERRLSVVEELEAVVSSNLQRATRLRQSILQKAFSGNLVAQQTVSHGEKPQLKPLRRHFARAVLSAEIVGQLHSEPTFGRIKHQKILYLCEYIAQMEEIQGQYHREAAGPLDNKLIYANEAELERQSWYKTTTKSSYGHSYQTMLKAGGHRKYLERFGAEKLLRINQLIELMRTWNTDRCEIFATVYAAWNDLILWKKEPTPKAILHEILNRWNETKQRIPESRWLKAIEWMKQNGFEPTGFGVPTTKPE